MGSNTSKTADHETNNAVLGVVVEKEPVTGCATSVAVATPVAVAAPVAVAMSESELVNRRKILQEHIDASVVTYTSFEELFGHPCAVVLQTLTRMLETPLKIKRLRPTRSYGIMSYDAYTFTSIAQLNDFYDGLEPIYIDGDGTDRVYLVPKHLLAFWNTFAKMAEIAESIGECKTIVAMCKLIKRLDHLRRDTKIKMEQEQAERERREREAQLAKARLAMMQ